MLWIYYEKNEASGLPTINEIWKLVLVSLNILVLFLCHLSVHVLLLDCQIGNDSYAKRIESSPCCPSGVFCVKSLVHGDLNYNSSVRLSVCMVRRAISHVPSCQQHLRN